MSRGQPGTQLLGLRIFLKSHCISYKIKGTESRDEWAGGSWEHTLLQPLGLCIFLESHPIFYRIKGTGSRDEWAGAGKRKPRSRAAFILVFRTPGSLRNIESFGDKFLEGGTQNDYYNCMYCTVQYWTIYIEAYTNVVFHCKATKIFENSQRIHRK